MRLYQLVDPDFARIAEQITRPRNARFLGPHFLPILRVADEADPKVSCPVTWGPAETRYFQGCLRSDHYPQTSHRQICIDLLHSSLIAIEFVIVQEPQNPVENTKVQEDPLREFYYS